MCSKYGVILLSEPYIAFRVPEKYAKYLNIITSDSNEILISRKHLIHTLPCDQILTAANVHHQKTAEALDPVKDCLIRHEANMLHLIKIQNITATNARGVYAPVTEAGNLLVNGYLASSYTR